MVADNRPTSIEAARYLRGRRTRDWLLENDRYSAFLPKKRIGGLRPMCGR